LITIRPNTRPFGIFLPFTPYAERQSHLFATLELNMLRVQELRKKIIIIFLGFCSDNLLVQQGFPGQTGLALKRRQSRLNEGSFEASLPESNA
jgi:hypothetical protein